MKNNTSKIVLGVIMVLVVGIVLIKVLSIQEKGASMSTDSAIKIGVLIPMTGDFAELGEEFRRGLILGQEEVDASSDYHRKVELIIEDNKLTNPQQSLAGAQKLVTIDKVDAAILTSSIEPPVVWKLFDSAQIPAITMWDSNPQIESYGDYQFGIGPWTPSSGELPAQIAIENGKTKAAIIVFPNEWSENVSTSFKNKFTDLGGDIVYDETISDPKSTDFRTLLLKVKNSGADVIYTPADDLYPILKTARSMNFTIPFMTSDIIDEDLVRENPELYEGVYVSLADSNKNDISENLYKKYEERFGAKPNKRSMVAWAYDSVVIIAKAGQDAEKPKDIAENIYQLSFNGASHAIEFTKQGSSPSEVVVFRVEGGKLVPQKLY